MRTQFLQVHVRKPAVRRTAYSSKKPAVPPTQALDIFRSAGATGIDRFIDQMPVVVRSAGESEKFAGILAQFRDRGVDLVTDLLEHAFQNHGDLKLAFDGAHGEEKSLMKIAVLISYGKSDEACESFLKSHLQLEAADLPQAKQALQYVLPELIRYLRLMVDSGANGKALSPAEIEIRKFHALIEEIKAAAPDLKATEDLIFAESKVRTELFVIRERIFLCGPAGLALALSGIILGADIETLPILLMGSVGFFTTFFMGFLKRFRLKDAKNIAFVDRKPHRKKILEFKTRLQAIAQNLVDLYPKLTAEMAEGKHKADLELLRQVREVRGDCYQLLQNFQSKHVANSLALRFKDSASEETP